MIVNAGLYFFRGNLKPSNHTEMEAAKLALLPL
uniref:Uncharacterized protein n=1 Tax=Anguilla anguilla TaxID=7936 RepID=A0A0E9TN65_ANGAN